MATERLQKILARAGIASRRAAEELIVAGRIRVNGRIVTELGTKADPRNDKVEVDGKRIVAESLVYVLLHKPRGFVSTMSDPEGRATVRELVAEITERLFPIGRLDFATSGALLMTNDGEFADALMHPRKKVGKTYVLKVLGVMQEHDLEKWRKGIQLEDGITLPAEVTMLRQEEGKTWLELTIFQGRNQQIRRMGDATGFKVMRLARTAVAGISTAGLPPGKWRHLTRDELQELKQAYGVPKRVPHADADRAAEGGRIIPRLGGGDRTSGPRFGGGAPARRGYEVTEDWGGGAGRGSSSGREGAAASPRGRSSAGRSSEPNQSPTPRPGMGGRTGQTRTTGSSGGIGARPTGEGGATGSGYGIKGRRKR